MKSILPNLSQYKIVLGSNSPRRRELLAGLDIDFEVQTIPDIDESVPKLHLRLGRVPGHLPDCILLPVLLHYSSPLPSYCSAGRPFDYDSASHL